MYIKGLHWRMGHRFARMDRDRGERDHGRDRDDSWGREGRHGHRFGRHGGRRMRIFDQGDLRLVLLHLIAEKPRHGYEVIKAIEEMLGGAYSPSPGVVYPNLTLIEEQGYASVSEQDGKKLYTLTEAGKAHLAENKAMIDVLLARIAEIGAAREGGPPPAVIRATENLKLALRLKLAQDTLTSDQSRIIARALDEAAAAIEQA